MKEILNYYRIFAKNEYNIYWLIYWQYILLNNILANIKVYPSNELYKFHDKNST